MAELEERRIAIYSRKSKFTGKGESIENQIGLCRQYIELHYGDMEAKNCLVYEDEGFSGKNLERPQFKRMLADGRAGRISAIIVYRLDRISRNIGDFASLIERFNDFGISFVSIKEQFDTGSPMGRAMMYIASVFSQLERETIAERIRDNMRELAKTGRWLGGVTPTGYISENISKVTIDGKVKKSCQLSFLQYEAETVGLIFKVFLKNGSLAQTEAFLGERDIRTKKGNIFSRFALNDILSNPVYMAADEAAYHYFIEQGAEIFCPEQLFDGSYGIMAYNRTDQKQGKTNRKRDVSEWIIAVGAHKWLVTGKDWVRVQKILKENKKTGGRRTKENCSIFSDCVFCGLCGAHMRAKIYGGNSVICSGGERRFSYLCTGKEKSFGALCSMENMNGKKLDGDVVKSLSNLQEDEKLFARKLEQARREFERKEFKEPLHWMDAEEIERLCDCLSAFYRILESMEKEERRMTLREIVKKVIWDGENIHVYVFHTKDSIDNK